jgi:cyanophycinase
MGIFALAGGAEFEPAMSALDQAILRRVVYQQCRVAILPTAVAPYRPDLAVLNAVRHFTSLGAEVRPVMVLTRSDAENYGLAEQLNGVDVIYLAGGDPWYLQNTLEATPVWDMIMEQYALGRIVVGSSAGAMVMGDVMWQREQALWKSAFGLAGGIGVLAHLDEASKERVESLWGALPHGFTMIGIDTSTGLIVDSERGTAEVVGVGGVTLFGAQEAIRYNAPTTFEWR